MKVELVASLAEMSVLESNDEVNKHPYPEDAFFFQETIWPTWFFGAWV